MTGAEGERLHDVEIEFGEGRDKPGDVDGVTDTPYDLHVHLPERRVEVDKRKGGDRQNGEIRKAFQM